MRRINQIKRWISSDILRVSIFFLVSVLIYGIIVSLFTSTVHIDTDEESYLTLAKTFHYYGNFYIQKRPNNSSYILYSIIISMAYFFYTPSTILFTIRMMGVIMICSSIFPIWLLASEVLENKKQAMRFSVLMMIMPYMYNCGYIMQEVLSFPLFMWFLFFLWKYIKYDEQNESKNNLNIVILAFFTGCSFLTKTYMMFIPIAVNIWMIVKYFAKGRNKKYIKQMLLYSSVVMCIILLGNFLVLVANDFITGDSHYQRILTNIFPISIRTVWGIIQDSIIYLSLLLINMGLFPVLGLISYHQKWKGARKDLYIFCLISIPLLILEIIFLIVLGEENIVGLPSKFVFRFFQIFIPPVFLLFYYIRNSMQIYEDKIIYIVSLIAVFISGVYFFLLGGNSRQAIMDGYIYLMLENITKYIIPYGDILGIVLLGSSILLLGHVFTKPNKQKFVKITIICFFIFFWLVNLVQLPFYTNIVADGSTIQKDGIKIANYLNDEQCENVYYFSNTTNHNYIKNFYGYIKQDYQNITEADLENIIDSAVEPIAVIIPINESVMNNKVEKPVLRGERLNLYIIK